MTSLIDTP